VKIQPSQLGTRCVYEYENIDIAGTCSLDFPDAGSSSTGSIDLGHDYKIDGDNEDDVRYFFDILGIVRFDHLASPNMVVSEVMGKPILSADLKFRMNSTEHRIHPNWHNFAEPCASALGAAKNTVFMKTSPDAPTYDLIQKPAHISAPSAWDEISVDVTDVVSAWAQGQSNFGFILDGRHGASGAFEWIDYCKSTYDNFRLEVTYFPNQ
jgi:hypothetical protein